MRPNAYLSSLLSLLLLAGCADRLEMPSVIDGGSDRPGQTVADGTPIDVPFCVSYSPMTKSSLTVGEDAVNDINIVAFRNGTRVTFVYTTPDSDITLQLVKGESYNIYAVANVGAISIPSSESDFLDYSYSIDSIDDLNGGFPMWWKLEGFTAGVLTSPVDIELERLVAKVRLSLMAPDMEGFEVTSVRLCQAASTIRPFAAGGSRALSGETLDGDYASAADLTMINNGGSICFYTFENCQGTLLEGNIDPWNKVPDNMGGKDDVCTYIEITCEHDGSFLLDGTVTYRMYLGADNCSNFDILRNKNYNLTLTATYAGMSQADISWKVDVDCEVSNAGDAGIQVGAHAEDDLYIGEVIVMGFNTSQAFVDYIGEEPNECELVLVKNGVESDAAWFESITNGDYDASYDCIMHCVDVVSGAELYLKKDNHLICKLPLGSGEKLNIQKPRVFFSLQSTCIGQVTQLTSVTPILNGEPKTIYAFLVDNQGYNLNTSSQYFDLSLFNDLNCTLWYIGNPEDSIIVDYCSQTKTSLSGANSACAKFELALSIPKDEYKSKYSSIPRIWAQKYNKPYNSLKYIINSSKIAVSDDLLGYFDIITPSFTWDMTKEKLIVYNPSYICIDFELYEVSQSTCQNHSLYRSITTTGYHAYPGNLHIHKIDLNVCSSNGVNQEDEDGSVIKELYFDLDYPDNNNQQATWMVTQSISGNSFSHNTNYLSIAQGPSGDTDHFGYFLPFDCNDEMVSCGIFSELTFSDYEYQFMASLGQKKLTTDRAGYIVIKDIKELYDEVSRPHAKITLNYLSKGISATVTSDPYNIVYKTEVTDGKVSGTCTHRNYSTQSYSTDNHNIYIPGSTATSLSGGTNYNISTEVYSHSYGTSSYALSSSDIAQYMKALNIGCWSNSCDKAVANANNRFSSFTQPSSFNVEFAAYGQNRFVPVDIITNIVNSNATVEGNIFTSTNPGTYSLDHYGDSNLDGSTRNKKNINSEIKVSTSNSSYVTGKAYTLTVSAKEDNSFTYYIR